MGFQLDQGHWQMLTEDDADALMKLGSATRIKRIFMYVKFSKTILGMWAK